MITAKFGGTAITPYNLVRLKEIVSNDHNCVVVSAIGKSHPQDIKTTDLLKMCYVDKNDDYWRIICERYRQLVEVNGVDIDIDRLLCDAYKRLWQYNVDYAMSIGEELSAKVVSRYLGGNYIEAQNCIIFNKGKLRYKQTVSRLYQAFEGVHLGVIGGFYGGCENGRKTFSRGGSDVTASICASAIGSNLCQNWTDVNGVCQCDPASVKGAKTIMKLSYEQMHLLSQSGANVLHPDAILPLQQKGIPLYIGNYLNTNAPTTVVSNCPNLQKFICVTQKKYKMWLDVTVVHNMTLEEVTHCLQKLFQSSQNYSKTIPSNVIREKYQLFSQDILQVALMQNIVKIFTKNNIIQQIFYAFCDTL